MVICVFQERGPFCRSYQLCGVGLFVVFPYYPSDVCQVCSDISCFVPDIGNLSSFFFVSFAISLFILFIYLKNQLYVSLMFLSFQCQWFLFFIISSFGWFFFSFSSLLIWQLRLLRLFHYHSNCFPLRLFFTASFQDFVFNFQKFNHDVFSHGFPWVYSLWYLCSFLYCIFISLAKFGESPAIISLVLFYPVWHFISCSESLCSRRMSLLIRNEKKSSTLCKGK